MNLDHIKGVMCIFTNNLGEKQQPSSIKAGSSIDAVAEGEVFCQLMNPAKGRGRELACYSDLFSLVISDIIH